MTTSTRRQFHGIWLNATTNQIDRPDLFTVAVPSADPDLIFLIGDGHYDVVLTPPGPGKDFYLRALCSQNRQFMSALIEALGSMNMYADGNATEDVRVYCHGAFVKFNGKGVLICVGLKPPLQDDICTPKPLRDLAVVKLTEIRAGKAAAEAHKALKAIEDEQFISRLTPDKRRAFELAAQFGPTAFEKEPSQPDSTVLSFLHAFPQGLPVALHKSDPAAVERAALRTLQAASADSHFLPSSEGHFDVLVATANPNNITAVITWTPYHGLPRYPEIRSAVERRLPMAFSKPRQTGANPPHSPPQNADPLDELASAGGFDPLAADWLDAFDDLADYNFPDRHDRAKRSRETVLTRGFEAIAWYQPFHIYMEDDWGIYFDAEKLDDIVCLFSADLRSEGLRTMADAMASQMMFGMIYSHEIFHARVEAVMSWMELTTGQSRYLRYKNNVYHPAMQDPGSLEEALANWCGWTFCQSEAIVMTIAGVLNEAEKVKFDRIVADTLDLSPPGYNQWRLGDSRETWRVLATQMALGKAKMPSPGIGLPIESLLRDPLPFDLSAADIPLRFVGNGQAANRILSSPATLNLPSRREVRRALERFFGYELVPGAGKGSHEKFQGKDGRMFPLPRRDPVSSDVFKAFLVHFKINKAHYIDKVRPAL